MPHSEIPMKDFLRENWVYIVAPLVIVIVGVVLLVAFGGGPESNFTYPLF